MQGGNDVIPRLGKDALGEVLADGVPEHVVKTEVDRALEGPVSAGIELRRIVLADQVGHIPVLAGRVGQGRNEIVAKSAVGGHADASVLRFHEKQVRIEGMEDHLEAVASVDARPVVDIGRIAAGGAVVLHPAVVVRRLMRVVGHAVELAGRDVLDLGVVLAPIVGIQAAVGRQQEIVVAAGRAENQVVLVGMDVVGPPGRRGRSPGLPAVLRTLQIDAEQKEVVVVGRIDADLREIPAEAT